MKREDLRGLEDRELVVRERRVAQSLATSEFRLSIGQLEKTHELAALRKQRARLKTEVRRRELDQGLAKDEIFRRHVGAVDDGVSTSATDGEAAPKKEGLLASLRRRLTGMAEQGS